MRNRTSDAPQQDGDRLVLSVPEAATRLGVTPDAIRARLHRGTLAGEKVGGAWRVFLPDAPTGEQQDATGPQQDTGRPATDALVAALQDRIDSLERQLAGRTEEIRRKDELLARALARIPELPAGDMPQEAHTWPVRDAQPMRASETLIGRLRRLIGR